MCSLSYFSTALVSFCLPGFQMIYYYLWGHPAVLWLHCVVYSLSLETEALNLKSIKTSGNIPTNFSGPWIRYL